MLKQKVREKTKQACIPVTLTYTRLYSNIGKVIWKHWNLLELNESLKEIFNCQWITAFRRNKNLKELTGSNKIEKKILLQASTKNNYFQDSTNQNNV